MNKKIIIAVPLIVVIATVAVYFFVTMTSSSSKLYVDPSSVSRDVGEVFTVHIDVSGVKDLFLWQFKLRWDPAILETLNVTEGSFLKRGGDTYFLQKINSTDGSALASCTLLGDIFGVDGDGDVAAVQFRVKGSGQCNLELFDTQLFDSYGYTISYSSINGSFTTP